MTAAMLAGLTAESRTAVEILDANGERHVIQRDNILAIESSTMSVMPEGFELLARDELAGLLEYLGSAEHAGK